MIDNKELKSFRENKLPLYLTLVMTKSGMSPVVIKILQEQRNVFIKQLEFLNGELEIATSPHRKKMINIRITKLIEKIRQIRSSLWEI
jgi:hypothetical protein